MKREDALFKKYTRIYKQASEASLEILNLFTHSSIDLSKLFKKSFCSESLEITSVEDLERSEKIIINELKKTSKKLSREFVIPILYDAVSKIYFDPVNDNKVFPNLGPACKTGMSFLFDSRGVDRSKKTIIYYVKCCLLWETLNSFKMLYEESQELSFTLLSDLSCLGSDDFLAKVDHYNTCTSEKGQGHRFVRYCTAINPLNYMIYLTSVERVCSGEELKNIKFFEGSFFSQLKFEDYSEFWTDLYIRLLVIKNLIYLRVQVLQEEDVIAGISIIEPYGIAFGKGVLNQDQCLKSIKKLFWTMDWCLDRRKEWASNLVVERTSIRLTENSDIFVDSAMMSMDSLNWYIESSLMGYLDSTGVSLEKVFQEYISLKFEKEVISYLREKGFCAGTVSDNGSWDNEKNEILSTPGLDRNPGELDVLAFHPQFELLLICECKVLHLNYNSRKRRNTEGKLGEVDSEGFRYKLKRKVEWLNRTSRFSKLNSTCMVPCILLDQPVPSLLKVYDSNAVKDIAIMDFKMFREFVEDLLSHLNGE